MFKINPNATFTAPVGLSIPGTQSAGAIDVTFVHKGRTALADWVKKPAAKAAEGATLSDADYLGEVISGWAGVKADDGGDVAYSPTSLALLLENYPASGSEIFDTYVKALTEAKAKN